MQESDRMARHALAGDFPPTVEAGFLRVFHLKDQPVYIHLDAIVAFYSYPDDETFPKFSGTRIVSDKRTVWTWSSPYEVMDAIKGVDRGY